MKPSEQDFREDLNRQGQLYEVLLISDGLRSQMGDAYMVNELIEFILMHEQDEMESLVPRLRPFPDISTRILTCSELHQLDHSFHVGGSGNAMVIETADERPLQPDG